MSLGYPRRRVFEKIASACVSVSRVSGLSRWTKMACGCGQSLLERVLWATTMESGT